MTDEQINRLVAERVMGWTNVTKGDGAYAGMSVGCPPGENHMTWVPDVCTDPAAWGALLAWLQEQGRDPMLHASRSLLVQPGNPIWEAILMPDDLTLLTMAWGRDALPGRALALAALRAYGVEVPDGHP